jgi:hypothetical protein
MTAPTPENKPILLRAYVEPVRAQRSSGKHNGKQRKGHDGDWFVILDCETTTDPGQALRFGFCRVYFRKELRHEICFYRSGQFSKSEMALINSYAQTNNITLMTADTFIDRIFYKYGYACHGMIIGFNLPFDLSRLAISHGAAHTTKADKSMHGGFSLKLSSYRWCPPIQVKHLSRFVSFMRFAGYASPANRSQRKRGRYVPVKRGYFLDVRTLAAAILSRSFSLEALAEFLAVPSPKKKTEEHGKALTVEYLEYARRDVETTWECYQALCERYRVMSLNNPITSIFSEASIGKAYFDQMGLKPWLELQAPPAPRELLATIASTFFGGRSEVRIRRELRQVVLCDFLSMYSTVCTLMGLWNFVTASGMRWTDGTQQVRRLLRSWKLSDLQKKENWRHLIALVQVKPDCDIFPVRAPYGPDGDGTIGANYLTSKWSLWFTLADCVAAQQLTGKPVRIERAIVFAPKQAQSDLKEIVIGDGTAINPLDDDLYKGLIELRHEIKRRRDASTADYANLDTAQNTIKITASATSYGIFGEINVNDRASEELVRVSGGSDQSFLHLSNKVEQPGRFFHPLLATSITGAARLMLAIAEKLVTDAGLEWAFCDTDSIAIARPEGMPTELFYEKVDQVVGWFRELNPYNFGGDILKIEDVNYGLETPTIREHLFVWAVSAKRYVLFNIKNGRPIVRKASAHGLGHIRAPYTAENPALGIPSPQAKLSKIGVQLWQHDLWWTIANAAIEGRLDKDLKFDFHEALKHPAMSQYAATTPRNLKWFDEYNSDRSYPNQVKPFGFVCAFYAGNSEIDEKAPGKQKSKFKAAATRPVGPFDQDPRRAAKAAFDRITGRAVTARELRTYQNLLAHYHLHPEDKFLNGDYLDRGTTLRRHVVVQDIKYIGKESNRWEEMQHFGFNPEDEIHYGAKPASRKSMAKSLARIVEAKGLRATALEIGISRAKLSKLLEIQFADCPTAFLQRISGIIAGINSKLNQENRQNSDLLALSKAEIRKAGISKFARLIKLDPSNLAKIISGNRALSATVLQALRIYFAGRPKRR